MKVIFLDIDGCLNTEKWRNSAEEYFDKPICEEHMCYLRFLVEETDAKIVLSSTWKENWNEGMQQVNSEIGYYLNKTFAKYGLEIYSKTIALPGNNRNDEIIAFLADHCVDNYVVIDDVDYDFDEKHFVKTSDATGLDERAVEKAIKILNGEGYAETKNADEEWGQVRAIIKDAVGETTFDIWFKTLKLTAYFPGKMLFISSRSFARRIIEDSEVFAGVLDRAIRAVFGDKIEYQIEDEDVGEDDVDLLVTSNITDTPVRKKIVYDPYSVYKNPEIRAFKIREKLRKILMLRPELIFKSNNPHYEILFRVLLIFMNAGELIGITDKIAVSRRNNRIEIYSRDCAEFLVDKVETEKQLFHNSHYDKYVIRNYDKKKRYIPAPFHIRSSVKGMGTEEDFYANIDSYFTLFSLINMANVRFESVKDGHFCCVNYEKGINSKGIEEGETNKKNGTYITYTAPDEDQLTNDEICDILSSISLISGIKTSFFDPDKGDWLTYNYKNAADYLDKYISSAHKSFCSSVKGGGRDRYDDSYYNAKIEVGFQLAQSKGFSKSFYNYSLLPEDNVFAEQVFEILAEKFNEWLKGKIIQRFSAEEIMRNFAIIISVKTDYDYEAWEPMRAEPVKARRMLSDLLEDVFENFLYWLGERDQVELLSLVFDIFKNKDNGTFDKLFPDGMK